MYYLLEDNRRINRIIDSENLRKDLSDGTLLDPVFDIKEEKNKVHYYFEGLHLVTLKIIKQSENVLDLIEVGDLVKLDKTLNQVITILKEDKRTIFEIGDNKWFSFKELNNYLNNNLLAIYKPNSNGNYIKVWEAKEE